MRTDSSGFTLVELMIVVAILTVLAGIAIPAYNNYIREAQFATVRMNVEPLRLTLEDFWLDNSTYGPGGSWTAGAGTGSLLTNYGWRPDGDEDRYTYTVTASTNTFTIVAANATTGHTATCPKAAACTYSP